ncbi:MAG: acylphosphatase, partial [Candidatus Methanoperedens sp.]
MALKRANVFVSGNVQMAGFRTFVKNFADSLDVKGYAENLPDGRVKIVCEGEEENISKLENSLKETPPPFARVEHTENEFVPYAGEFTGFERRGDDVIEDDESTTTLLKSMVNYMKIFVDKSEVVNVRLGEIKVSIDDMHVTLKSVKEDTTQIREDTAQIRVDTTQIRSDTSQILEDTSNISLIVENTSLIPEIAKNTSLIPDIAKNTSLIPLIVENTSHIPAMREDTSAIKNNTREIGDSFQGKYEEMSREISQMK